MSTPTIEADYLVTGTGAAGMAFVDALITDSEARIVMVDRRHAPGGHWNDAYPFVRLHQPSAYYGVNSLPLGEDRIDCWGGNEGLQERASAAEICGYYNRVMDHCLLPSGKVQHFPMCDYLGEHRFVSRVSGIEYRVSPRAKLVDANYLQPDVPSRTPPPFEVAAGVRCIAVNQLATLSEAAARYVVVGGGKTAIDACLWLLERDVAPEHIRWIRPRECWLVNREFGQSGDHVASILDGLSLQMEAAAQAESIADLFQRLEASAQLMRIDSNIEPSMFKYATVSTRELEQLRRIKDVVRLGRVKRIDADQIVLERGTIPTAADHLHVHCAAAGLKLAPPVPIFAEDRITLQPVRAGLVPFNAAIVGYIEATRTDTAEKNRLCPPNPYPDAPFDWLRSTIVQMRADRAWAAQPDIAAWLERSRLNASRGLLDHANEVRVQDAFARFRTHVKAGLQNLEKLIA
ncbi:MAG: hypothetical protein ACHQ53_08120 [Polyangiales bacterium]